MIYNGEPGHWWFRLTRNGPGLFVKDTTRHRLIFSERYGYTKYVRLGRWIIGYLRMIRSTTEP